MKVDVYPSKVSGSITPPPSKSFLHRAIISASLAKGHSTINNIILSDDVLATVNAFKSLGVQIDINNNSFDITSNGYGSFNKNIEVDCNESGSTIRFLIPILSNNNFAYFKGKTSLINRPFNVYEDIFKKQGLVFYKSGNSIITKGQLSPGKYIVPGDISSQFISGLLFVLPLLNGDSTIEIVGDFESKQYVDMTVNILKRFGVNITKNKNIFYIKKNQKYVSTSIDAEIDYSQMAFFAVLGTINNDIKIMGLNDDSMQPDRKIIDIINLMGGKIKKDHNSLNIYKSKTYGITIDVSQSPDIAPILGILASSSLGTTNLINAKRLIIKESNRLLSIYNTLIKFGVKIDLGEDSLTIHGPSKFKSNIFDSYNDHRIVMMIAIAATIAKDKVTIKGAEAVKKSYPNFFQDLEKLGVKIKYL